jgi:hypothetical protein
VSRADTTKAGKRERLAYIESEARALARTGDHKDFSSIEMLFLIRGYQEARKLFANLWTQEELNRICRQARTRRASATANERLAGGGQ